MGGIYTLGISPGTVLAGNLIHDVERVTYGGWGIYYDEGSSGIVSENNLIFNTHDGGFHQHYGQENVFKNNIIGPSKGVQLTGSRIKLGDNKTIQTRRAFTFERNIVYGWGAETPDKRPWPDLKLKPPHDLYKLDHNLYWNEGKPVAMPARDVDSVSADPGFKDIAHNDYDLRSDSPAFNVGFTKFDVSHAGRLILEAPDLDPVRWPRMFPASR